MGNEKMCYCGFCKTIINFSGASSPSTCGKTGCLEKYFAIKNEVAE